MSGTEEVQEFIKLSLMTAHLDRARDGFAERVTHADIIAIIRAAAFEMAGGTTVARGCICRSCWMRGLPSPVYAATQVTAGSSITGH
jgi:hypothetical protein